MNEKEILQGLDESFVKQANIEVDKRWGKQFGASISNDYQKSITKIHSKIYHKAIVGAKIIGLLAVFGSVLFFVFYDNTNFLNQINNISNAYLNAFVELIYFATLLIFVVMMPLKIIELAFGLHGLHLAKGEELKEIDEYSDWDLMSDENITNANLWDGVNIDGTPMYNGVDMNGNPYGVTNNDYGSAIKY